MIKRWKDEESRFALLGDGCDGSDWPWGARTRVRISLRCGDICDFCSYRINAVLLSERVASGPIDTACCIAAVDVLVVVFVVAVVVAVVDVSFFFGLRNLRIRFPSSGYAKDHFFASSHGLALYVICNGSMLIFVLLQWRNLFCVRTRFAFCCYCIRLHLTVATLITIRVLPPHAPLLIHCL